MRYWFCILFFVNLGIQAQSPFQNALLASKAQAAPLAIYQGNDPTDPNYETSDVSNYLTGSGHTWSSSTVRATDGTRSSRLVTTGAVADSNIPLIGTVSGTLYYLALDVYSDTVSGNNYVWLDPARGWSGADVDGVTYELIPITPGWNTIYLQAVAGQDDAPVWFSMGSNITIDIDKTIVSETPLN